MPADSKVPEWKQILDSQRAKLDSRSDKLRAARLAAEAAAPPPPPPAPKRSRAKKEKTATA